MTTVTGLAADELTVNLPEPVCPAAQGRHNHCGTTSAFKHVYRFSSMCKPILYFFFFFSITFSAGCDHNGREQALRDKESALNLREADLVNRERIVEAAEAKLKATKAGRDAAFKPDSSSYYQPVLTGDWQVRMTCTESNCTGFAVGDSRTEQWTFSYVGYSLFVTALTRNTFSRAYKGYAFENSIELRERRDSNRASADVSMKIRLQLSDSTTMAGDREIIQDNSCKVVYALQLKKIQ
jgi:hypothetical protein